MHKSCNVMKYAIMEDCRVVVVATSRVPRSHFDDWQLLHFKFTFLRIMLSENIDPFRNHCLGLVGGPGPLMCHINTFKMVIKAVLCALAMGAFFKLPWVDPGV